MMKFKRDILTGLSNICRVYFVLFLCNILFMEDIGNFSYACIDALMLQDLSCIKVCIYYQAIRTVKEFIYLK